MIAILRRRKADRLISKAAAGTGSAASRAGEVLLVLAAGQFLMTLDMSVMNVSIASVAADLGTTVTGIQTAITLYTLVMASLMITGGKIGAIFGRRRVFGIGCVIYGAGSLTTALAPNLTVLIIGWSLLEGIGAALIMPAIVALVASNFAPERRTSAYGTIAAAGAIAVAAGPLIGGAVTTFFSWRWVFAGEVLIVIVLLVMLRVIRDAPLDKRPRIDFVGVVMSVTGLSMTVFGVLRSSEWGWVQPKPGGPELFGLSPTVWLILGGILIVYLFFQWQAHVERRGREPLIQSSMLGNRQLNGGLTMFFMQFLVQAGAFFVIPLFLSVVLGLSAVATGARLLPLSIALLVFAAGIPRFRPMASPRRVVRLGLMSLAAGTVILIGAIDPEASPEIVTVPLLFMGAGIGALASQLGAVTVSAVDDKQSAEVGGLQNTVTNLGASLGTALVGSVLIAVLTSTLLQGVMSNPDIPPDVKSQAEASLQSGAPFVSDADAQTMLTDAGLSPAVTEEVLADNSVARLDALRASLSLVALVALIALFFSARIPEEPPGAVREGSQA